MAVIGFFVGTEGLDADVEAVGEPDAEGEEQGASVAPICVECEVVGWREVRCEDH